MALVLDTQSATFQHGGFKRIIWSPIIYGRLKAVGDIVKD